MKIITKAVLDMETMQWVSIESCDYDGPVDLCCGPTTQEKQLQASSANFASMLQSNYGTLFGEQQDVLSSINKSLSPTLAAGPNQQGFSGPELAAIQTQAIDNAGAANTAAQQAARNYGAGEGGGGTSGVTSGIQKQIQSAIGSSSANALAGQENQITQANYAQGNANYWRAAGGMQALAGEYSPNGASSGAISENNNSFGQASQIEQQQAQEDQAIAGGITSLATDALTFGAGGIGNMGEGSGAGDFLSGGLSALGGKG
jgi:hypothetical protein